MKFKNNIAYYRKLRGMTQAELSERLGYTAPAGLSKVENGMIDLPASKVSQIAKILNVSPVALMGIGDYEQPTEIDSNLLLAFHNAPKHIQDGIITILQIKEGTK